MHLDQMQETRKNNNNKGLDASLQSTMRQQRLA